MTPEILAAGAELARTCHCSHSSSGGLWEYELGRLLWHWLHWWTLLVVIPVGILAAWLKPDDRC